MNMSSYCGEDAHNVWFFPICIEFWKNPMNNLPSEYKCVMVRIITLLISYQYFNYNGEKVMNCTRKSIIFLTYKFMKKHWLQPIQKLCAIANPNWIVVRMGHTTMDHASCKGIFPLGCCNHIFCFSTLAFHYICLTSLLITH
jgi:hypothetical protein